MPTQDQRHTPISSANGRYLYQLREERERVSTERWLFGHGADLLEALGLPDGWWCGLFLPRKEIFFDGADGDVDLIAGPLRLAISSQQLRARVAKCAQKHGATFALAYALHEVGKEGLVLWPPTVRHVVACEIKSSWFDGESWKATHSSLSKQRRFRGQLNYLKRHGVNSVNALQLGSTVPSPDLDTVSSMLTEAAGSAPALLPLESSGAFGLARAIMAAADDGTEEMSGMHRGLEWLLPPQSAGLLEQSAWHGRFAERLASLPKPTYFRTFILHCADCLEWRHAGTSAATSVPCHCGSAASSLRASSANSHKP